MKTLKLAVILFVLGIGIHHANPNQNPKPYVSDAMFMECELKIDVLYQMEFARQASMRNTEVKQ